MLVVMVPFLTYSQKRTKKLQESFGGIKEIKTFFPDQKPSKIINEMRKQVKVEAFSDNRNKRPNDDNFRRTYFIRKLSKNFETYCGGKNVKLVTIIANNVFDSSISERQVRNTLRTVD